MEKIKRLWYFLQDPPYFGIKCNVCGEKENLKWSEYVGHIWCESCQEDISDYESPMDGPVPLHTASLIYDMRIICPYGSDNVIQFEDLEKTLDEMRSVVLGQIQIIISAFTLICLKFISELLKKLEILNPTLMKKLEKKTTFINWLK